MILDILLILLAAIGLLAGSLILLPVVVDLEAARTQETVPSLRLRALVAPWAGALGATAVQTGAGWQMAVVVLGTITLYRRTLTAAAPGAVQDAGDRPCSTPPEEKSREPGPGAMARFRTILADLLPYLPPGRRLLRRLTRVVGMRHLDVDVHIGLEDVAATGALYGQVQAISGLLPARVRIAMHPDFTRVTSQGRARLRLHLYLGRLLTSVARFAFSAGRVWLLRWWRQRATRTASATS